VDVGSKRIGVALSDPTQTIAQPLTTLTRRAGRRFPMRRLRQLIEQHDPRGVLVGLPLTPEGFEDQRAAEARAVAAELSRQAELPVMLWDERMTTARALRAVREMDGRLEGRRGDVDPLAATTLLQSYLDARR
jgi:putative Holliday junction resolvase